MDPNTVLQDIRDMIEYLNDPDETDHERTVAWDLAEMIEALDGWLSAGGFLPQDWATRGSGCQ